MWVKQHIRLRLWLIVVFLLIAAPIYSDETPSMAFLEFLGEWESPEGELVDPFKLAEVEDDDKAELAYSREEQKDE